MADGLISIDRLDSLTARQRISLSALLEEVRQAPAWSWRLPVLLHDRCWLRLSRIRVDQLQRWLPPDGGGDAPELIRYRELLNAGDSPIQAQQSCWQEFGTEDCQRALRGFWISQDSCRHGWTTTRYLDLLSRYRATFEAGDTALPVLVLARKGSREHHKLLWVSDSTAMMRHTCA